MNYVAEYTRLYPDGYVNLPSEDTPELAEQMNIRDDTIIKIEEFLASLDLGELGGNYALLSEAGYSLGLDIDSNYVMTISLKNKAGDVLSSKQIDFPIESMVVNATYENGKIILALQNGNTLPIDISDMVRGLVPTTRKIAGIDLADDITVEELKEALELGEGGEIPTKVSQLENDAGYITQDDIVDADAVSAGEIKPWLYDTTGEEVIVGVYGGKPLYQKIFVFPNSIYGRVDLDISLDNVETAFLFEARAKNSDGAEIPLPYIHSDTPLNIGIFLNSTYTKIGLRMGSSYTSTFAIHDVSATIRYTKTTDAEGSGNNLKPYGIYDAKLDDIEKDIEELQKPDITTTDQTTMPNSYDGKFLFKKIGGVCEQGENPSPTSPQEIKKSVVSGIKTHGKQFLDASNPFINKPQVAENGYVISYTGKVAWAQSGFINRKVKEGQTWYVSADSIENTIKNKGMVAFQQRDANKNIKSTTYLTEGKLSDSFTIGEEVVEFTILIIAVNGAEIESNNTTTVKGLMLSLVEGSKWEPYKESSIAFSNPIDLYGIGDVQDVITPKQINRRFAKAVFDGSEQWFRSAVGRFYTELSTAKKGTLNCICDSYRFVNKSHQSISDDEVTFYTDKDNEYPNQNWFYVCDDNYSYAADFAENLKVNPITIIYELAEETTEELPIADQIALNSLATYDGITYLEFDSEVQPTFEGEYGTSKVGGMTLESLLTARNNDLRLSSLEASVVNNI